MGLERGTGLMLPKRNILLCIHLKQFKHFDVPGLVCASQTTIIFITDVHSSVSYSSCGKYNCNYKGVHDHDFDVFLHNSVSLETISNWLWDTNDFSHLNYIIFDESETHYILPLVNHILPRDCIICNMSIPLTILVI